MTFKLRSEGGEGTSQTDMWEKSEFKVTEAGGDLACSRNSQASVAREERRRKSRMRARQRVGGARGGGARGGGARGGRAPGQQKTPASISNGRGLVDTSE